MTGNAGRDLSAEIGAVARAAARIADGNATPGETGAFFERKARLLEDLGQPELARVAWEAADRHRTSCDTSSSLP